jgi:hypothetical protein
MLFLYRPVANALLVTMCVNSVSIDVNLTGQASAFILSRCLAGLARIPERRASAIFPAPFLVRLFLFHGYAPIGPWEQGTYPAPELLISESLQDLPAWRHFPFAQTLVRLSGATNIAQISALLTRTLALPAGSLSRLRR